MSSFLCLFPLNLSVTLILCVSFLDIAIYIYCQCYVLAPPRPNSPFQPLYTGKKTEIAWKGQAAITCVVAQTP